MSTQPPPNNNNNDSNDSGRITVRRRDPRPDHLPSGRPRPQFDLNEEVGVKIRQSSTNKAIDVRGFVDSMMPVGPSVGGTWQYQLREIRDLRGGRLVLEHHWFEEVQLWKFPPTLPPDTGRPPPRSGQSGGEGSGGDGVRRVSREEFEESWGRIAGVMERMMGRDREM